jgi:hypothetical protein
VTIRPGHRDTARILDALGLRSSAMRRLDDLHCVPTHDDARRALALVLSGPRPSARVRAIWALAVHLEAGNTFDVSALSRTDMITAGHALLVLTTLDGPDGDARAALIEAVRADDDSRFTGWLLAEPGPPTRREDGMSRRPPSLAEREARARAVTAERVAADRTAARTARLADVRARLALAEAARAARPVVGASVYSRPPTPPALEDRAARARRWPSYFADEARERDLRAADLLAATSDSHDAYA